MDGQKLSSLSSNKMINKKRAESVYDKSIDVLKEVQLRNGGCMATPKGERYPYVYPRDHAVILLGFLSAGMPKRVRKGLEFVFKGQLKSGAFPQRLDIKGNDASYKPIQIDGTALIIYALARYVKETEDYAFLKKHHDCVLAATRYIQNNFYEEKDLIFTPNSIHEFPPMEKGLEIWANAACYGALNEISDLEIEKAQELNELSNKVQTGMIRYMWNPRVKSFVKNIRIKESSSVETDVDASAILIADINVFPDDDERVRQTVKRIERELWNKKLGGICRYPKYEGRNNGGWGPWPHFTLMICRHYIRLRNRRAADKYLNWVLKTAWKDQLPEHIATVKEFEEYVTDFTHAGLLRKDRMVLIENARKHPMFKKGTAYITTPLAWPHAEFIRTWNLYKEVFKVK